MNSLKKLIIHIVYINIIPLKTGMGNILTSQYQSFTSIIDWIEIYDAYVESKLSYRTFYKQVFPSLIKNIMLEGYIPSITTFNKHIFKIKKTARIITYGKQEE
jgi:hypothetical protein